MIQIPGYTDFSVLGQGGFATVHKARQLSVGRDVAIKVLSHPAPDADLIRRFERESRAVGALSWHPHIAAVVDAGTTTAGQAWIGFELLTGGSLEDRVLAHGPMPWQDAVASMIQVADAVEAAHGADVLHRDIKPANILLNRLGDAKLADFGIASMQDGTRTETGMLATTIAHAAPELFDGIPASTATDVYALGSTLFNLITGHPPFAPASGEPVAATIKRIGVQPPPQVDPGMAPDLVSGVIVHSLAKQPPYRPRSAAAFGKALQQVQRDLGLSVTAMPVSDGTSEPESSPPLSAPALAEPAWVEPSQRTSQPQRSGAIGRVIGVLIAVAVTLAAVIVGALLFQSQPLFETAGGARISSISALLETQIASLPPENALDLDPSTEWGIARNDDAERNIAGTTFVLKFDDEVLVTGVGIANAAESEHGRVSDLGWALSVDNIFSNDFERQQVPDEPGEFVEPVSLRTDQLVLFIEDVHDPQAATAAIGEILIGVSQ